MKAISTSFGNSFLIPSMKLFSKTGEAGSSCSGFGGVDFGGVGVSCSVIVDSFYSSLDGESFFSVELMIVTYLAFILLIFSCSNMHPWIKVSGLGGQPGTYTSTGRTPSIPGSTLYESKYKPPVIAQAPIAMTYFGSGI